jgi:hypothetical protein
MSNGITMKFASLFWSPDHLGEVKEADSDVAWHYESQALGRQNPTNGNIAFLPSK